MGVGLTRNLSNNNKINQNRTLFETPLFSNCLYGTGLVAAASSYFYKFRAEKSYSEYFAQSNLYEILHLHQKAMRYDKKASRFFYLGVGLVISGIINDLLFKL